MSSLALSIKPRNAAASGSSSGQQMRRSRSTSAYTQQRMSLATSIPTSSTRRQKKSYTQTLVEQRNKSKQQQQQQQQQRLVRSRSSTPRQNKKGGFKTSTPMALLSTSARKDPTLARNKYFFQKKSNNNNTTARDDFGTTRSTNQDSSREDNGIVATTEDDDNVPPPPPKRKVEPEATTLIDQFGDAVVDANDAMVAIVCDNKAVARVIFPYMDGDYHVPNDGGGEKAEENSVQHDFYTGLNCTLSEEGFEATPTALFGVGENAENGVGGGGAVAAAGGATAAVGVFSISKLGMLMKRQKKVKKSGKSSSDAKADADTDAEPADESKIVTANTDEGLEEGVEVQQGRAALGDSQGLTQEAEVLLSIYDPELDKSMREVEQVFDEGTIVEGQDLELEMLGDRNVLALGYGAFAVCGGDDNTIITSDQRELTLQDYANPAQQIEPILEDDVNSILDSTQRDQAKKSKKEKLLQEKRAVLRRMKARNLYAAKKALAARESKAKQSSRAKPVLADDTTIVSALQQEWTLDDHSNEKKKLPAEELIFDSSNTIVTSENRECTLDDYTKPKLFSRISSFKSKNGSDVKPSLENDETVPTSENRETLNIYSKPGSVTSNGSPTDKSVESKASKAQSKVKQNAGNGVAVTEDVNGSSSKNRREVESKTETREEEKMQAHTLLAAFNNGDLMLKSFEVDDGISMHSSISMATDLKSDGPGRQRSYPRPRSRLSRLSRYTEEGSRYSAEEESRYSAEGDSRYTEDDSIDIEESFTEESETSSMDASCKGKASWWNVLS
uniref:Uncharacterized protein n=1 Tax=Skeletonema marinoi TaxID=267567 RepID=A0A7S2PDY4_9STRA